MTNCSMLYAKDYDTKEEFFSAIKEYIDNGAGIAYNTSGMNEEDAVWLNRELSAYHYFRMTNWDVFCDHSLSLEMARFIPESMGGAKAYMENVLRGHSRENCMNILRREAGV